jgi:hypothetical protein
MAGKAFRTTRLAGALVALAGLSIAGCGAEAQDAPALVQTVATSVPSDLAAELTAIRQATAQFRNVEAALAAGYIPDPSGMCIDARMEGQPKQLGAMGIHYFRPDLLGISATEPRVNGTGTHTDFRTPAVLIYEPQGDGSLELVAIENLVFQQPWRDAGHTSAPSFMGYEYYSMINNPLTDVDEAHGFEPHYELHMWLYRDNPNGMFAPFNPQVSCPAQTHRH